ncbi:FAD-dependent oxidoreductase, partial [Thioclava sp. BHET1]
MSLARGQGAPAGGRTLDCEVAVIGAGVIGLAIAHRLAQAGREVMLIDPAAPGSGASYGNAGTIADYAVQPVGTPAVLRDLPRLMFDRDSPLAIRQASLPSLAPWLLRFLRQSLPRAAARNASAIAGLMAEAGPLWRALAAEIGGSAILQERGCLYLYESRAGYEAASDDMAQRRGHGVAVALISPSEVARLEPGLPPVAGGAYFPGAIFLDDPGRMVGLLADAALGAGAALLTGRVTALARGAAPELTVETAEGTRRLRAGHVVIAAGAHSRALARMAGSRIPLDTERGYHLEYEMAD